MLLMLNNDPDPNKNFTRSKNCLRLFNKKCIESIKTYSRLEFNETSVHISGV